MRVEYMTHSGDDLLVVNAARASFGKESEWDKGTELVYDEEFDVYDEEEVNVLSDRDKKLIDFLAREKHLLPFRHPTVTLRCRAPLFVARQLGKHQAGMSWSEESRRYITTEPEFYWPNKWRKKADNVKQGSANEAADTTVDLSWYVGVAVGAYEKMLEDGVAPELARMILPQNMMITWVWTGTMLAWNHMIKERTAPTTQRETQEFARMVEQIMNDLYPVSMEALREHSS